MGPERLGRSPDAGWHRLLEAARESPSRLETCFAIFANVLELDDQGEPVNEKYAERRAAIWLYRYCTGKLPPGEADLEPWECAPYRPESWPAHVRALRTPATAPKIQPTPHCHRSASCPTTSGSKSIH